MIVKAYGTRGSVPVSGRDKSIYGGNTTCWAIKSDRVSPDTEIIIDAGSGLIPLTEKIDFKLIKKLTILFTHYHQDHIIGLGLCPLMYFNNVKKQIFGPKDQESGSMEAIKYCFKKPFFPVTDEQIKSSFVNLMGNGIASNYILCFYEDLCTSIKLSEFEEIISKKHAQVSIKTENDTLMINVDRILFVKNINVTHPDQCLSYRFEEYDYDASGKSMLRSCFVLLTDCESQHVFPGIYKQHINNANLIAVDCQYSNDDYNKFAGFGHGSPHWIAEIASKCSGTNNIGITHHDPHSTDNKINNIVSECKYKATSKGVDLKVTNIFVVKDYDEFPL